MFVYMCTVGFGTCPLAQDHLISLQTTCFHAQVVLQDHLFKILNLTPANRLPHQNILFFKNLYHPLQKRKWSTPYAKFFSHFFKMFANDSMKELS